MGGHVTNGLFDTRYVTTFEDDHHCRSVTDLSFTNCKFSYPRTCVQISGNVYTKLIKAFRNVVNVQLLPSGGQGLAKLSSHLSKLPWQKIAMDICQHKRKDYLVIIDYYSRWIENKPADESNIGMCHQWCQSCLHYARRAICRRIGQWPTIRVGRVQTLCRRDVFHSTDDKSVLRTRKRHGRTGCANCQTAPRLGGP